MVKAFDEQRRRKSVAKNDKKSKKAEMKLLKKADG
jgi:hypothetical protein